MDSVIIYIMSESINHDLRLNGIQGDQFYMAVCFWYPVKNDLSGVCVYISVHWTSHFLKEHGHVYLVRVYH